MHLYTLELSCLYIGRCLGLLLGLGQLLSSRLRLYTLNSTLFPAIWSTLFGILQCLAYILLSRIFLGMGRGGNRAVALGICAAIERPPWQCISIHRLLYRARRLGGTAGDVDRLSKGPPPGPLLSLRQRH